MGELFFDKAGGSFSKMFPITTLNNLYVYYLCDNCGALYRVFNQTEARCAYCGQNDLKMISEDAYYNELKTRLEPDEWEDALKEREKESHTDVDLYRLGINKTIQDIKRNTN
jgi:predicted  nucleic acid-binding Zn-ribbon protein